MIPPVWSVAIIDPPWPKKKGGLRGVRPKQGKNLDYATMSVADIFSLLDKEIFPRALNRPHSVGITDILYDKNTETGILWELGAFGSGVIAVTDNGRGLYAGVMRDTHEQLEAWCSK